MPLLNHVDSIPNSHVATVKHYPNSILVTTKSGTLYSTKQFCIGVNSIVGDFEKMPESKPEPSSKDYPEPGIARQPYEWPVVPNKS